MEKHHHTIIILSLLCAMLIGVVGGWLFFTLRNKSVQVVMTEDEFMRPVSNDEVYVNGMPLEESSPLPRGDYWYDAQTGLYGHTGEAALGVMPIGYSAPSIASNASGGTTGVLFNGRELPEHELVFYEQELKLSLDPGEYTLDDAGMIWLDAESKGVITLGGSRPPPAIGEVSQELTKEGAL